MGGGNVLLFGMQIVLADVFIPTCGLFTPSGLVCKWNKLTHDPVFMVFRQVWRSPLQLLLEEQASVTSIRFIHTYLRKVW